MTAKSPDLSFCWQSATTGFRLMTLYCWGLSFVATWHEY
jgi:hypothetical protein